MIPPNAVKITKLFYWQPPLKNYKHLRPAADLGIQIGGKFTAGAGLRSIGQDTGSRLITRAGDTLVASGVRQLADVIGGARLVR